MIIKNITIENFRSYYGVSSINIGDGLTLIIGSNGDGKTTFYEALQWLFTTDGKKIADEKLISKKKAKELIEGESADVSVSLTYEHERRTNTLVKSFRFTKSLDGKISPSNSSFKLYRDSSVGKDIIDGINIEYHFPSEIRQYSMFKGETQLNVFRSADSLKVLLETFSDIKGFDPFIDFMDDSIQKATVAADRARSSDKTNAKKAAEYRSKINSEDTLILNMENELREKEKASADLEIMLSNIESSKEASDLLIAVNRRIDSLNSRKAKYYSEIKENYTIRLLDEMWVLNGFEPIAKEYLSKISKLDKAKRKMQSEHDQQKGARKLATQIEMGFVPLAVNVPDQKTMEELLESEVCKVCGRPAPKGSDPWLFMKHKLEDYLKSLTVDEDESEEDAKFKRHYIEELTNLRTTLNDNLAKDVTLLPKRIDSEIQENEKRHDEIARIDESLRDAQEKKNRILAGNEGMTEDDLTSAYHNITNMVEEKSRADRRIAILKREIPNHKEIRDGYVEKLKEISKDSIAESYQNTCDVLSLIGKAFKESRSLNKANLLSKIEKLSNEYLKKLNTGDFKGQIVITEPSKDTANAKLVDIDKMEVTNPNTALRSTYYMAILFAIAELSVEKNETEYPLIFDAPTSSFTEAKESEFFGVLGNIKKQVVVVTKSFLRDANNGKSILDFDRIKNIPGTIYRIEKKEPFDDEDLSTIQTVISKIK